MKSPESNTLSAALAASSDHTSDNSFGAATSASEADDGRRGILIRVTPKLRRDLKMAAAARDTTVQALLLGAIAIVLEEPPPPVPKP
jgi:hypothetical protein